MRGRWVLSRLASVGVFTRNQIVTADFFLFAHCLPKEVFDKFRVSFVARPSALRHRGDLVLPVLAPLFEHFGILHRQHDFRRDKLSDLVDVRVENLVYFLIELEIRK